MRSCRLTQDMCMGVLLSANGSIPHLLCRESFVLEPNDNCAEVGQVCLSLMVLFVPWVLGLAPVLSDRNAPLDVVCRLFKLSPLRFVGV